MKTQFIGLSGHLEVSAPGHYETFHKAIMEGIQESIGKENVHFLGSMNSVDENSWFQPVIPTSLTSKISWLPKKFLNSLISDTNSDKDLKVIYIYEGNFASLFLLGTIARRSEHVLIYFNLFDSTKYASIFYSPIKLFFYKMFFRFSIRGVKNKFFLVADTARFSQHLTSSLGQKFMTFPMYSGLTPSLVIGKERNVNLVNIRGIRAERLFGRVIEIDPRLSKIDIEVHGILDEEIASQLATYPNITIFNKHLTEESYFASYERYSKVTFLYDPQFFAMQSSGRLADAIVSGATLLVPKDTSLEDVLIEYGNGSSFDFDDETSLILGLLSEPSISRKVDYLPTNHWAAQMILNSIENLKETVNQKKVNKVSKIAAHFLDDFVWLLVGLTRLLFGLQRRIKLLVAQSD